MSPTYHFVVDLARRYAPHGARLLDFGCGGGHIVELALAADFDAFGVDSFQGVWEQFAPERRENRIRSYVPGETMPFDDAQFDIIVSNQVFEHIEDLAPVAAELGRLLRPGGTLITVFPTREVLIEPHLKAPFVHWFTAGSAAQRAALTLCHALHLCNRPQQERSSWVSGEQRQLQQYTFYRRLPTVIDELRPWFGLQAREEPAFLRHRLALHPRLSAAARLPAIFDPLFAQVTFRLANAVLVFSRKAGEKAAAF